MSGGLTRHQIQGIKKTLNRDYLKEKALRKQRRIEKATRQKKERHKSRHQEIDELVQSEIDLEDLAGSHEG